MDLFKLSLLLVLIFTINCTKKKSYTPAELLFIKQAKAYETKINDYLFELGTLQWRIYGIMDKYSNNPALYMADIQYQTLIKEKDKIVGRPTHSTFIPPISATTDMNINIINIGVDQDKIDSLDLTALKNTEGVIVMKDNGLLNQIKSSTTNPLLLNTINTQMSKKLNQQLLGVSIPKV